MKTSLYTSKYIDDRNKDYYIHNSLHGTTIRIFDNDLIDFAEKILRSKNEEIDENIITNKDFEGFYSTLKENKMVVESNINEKNIVNYRYQQFTDMDKTLGIIMTPTMACNFRCPYCYQDHEKLEMEDFIYEGTIKLILDTVKTKNMKNVIISWFGGEPTLKLDEIIKFMEELKEKLPDDVVLKGDMTTNGYLLNKINFKG